MSRQEIRHTVRSTPRSLASPRVINIQDLRHLAQRRLPKVVFDYLDGGAESEVTLRENCRVFDDVTFRPRQAVAIPECDLHTRVLSADLAFPRDFSPHWLQQIDASGRRSRRGSLSGGGRPCLHSIHHFWSQTGECPSRLECTRLVSTLPRGGTRGC